MSIIQAFDLNLIPNSAPVVVHVNQYDVGAGRFVISLYNGESQYTPASGATALIEGTKPDNKGYSYPATINGYAVTADLTQQMSVVPGKSRVNLIITEGNNRTGTFVFWLEVQPTGLSDDTDTSSSELAPYIDGAQAAARAAAEHATTAATAAVTATMAVAQIGDSVERAETAATTAEAAADIAEAATLHPPYIGNNGNWFVWDTTINEYVDSRIDASITVTAGTTRTLPAGSNAKVTNSGTNTDAVFDFEIPQGATGNGIQSITKTGSSGLIDTYTITYTNGTTSTFRVTNGADGTGDVSSVNNIQPVNGNVTLKMEDIEIGTATWNQIQSILS